MLATALQRLIDQKLTTARELGDLAGVSTSTVYRWINGESQPDFDAIRLLLRHLKNHKAQQEILSVFTSGTAWQLVYVDQDLDVNQDGRIDAQDALDACINAVQHTAESLRHVRAGTRPGTRLDSDQIVEILNMLNQVGQQCNITQRVLVKLTENRKQARVRLAE